MVGRPSHGHWARQGGGLPPGQWSRVNRRPRREGGHSPSRASPTRRGAQGAQAASPQAVRTSALGGPVWPGGWISPCAWGQGEGVASRGRCGVANLGASSANHGKPLKGPQINSHFLPDHHESFFFFFSEVYLPPFLWPVQNRNVEAPNLLSWLVLTAFSPKSS